MVGGLLKKPTCAPVVHPPPPHLRLARAPCFKTNRVQTIAILKKYAKTDATTLDSAHAYLKGAFPDMPYPTLEGMKTILAHMGRTRPEVLNFAAATMVDSSIVKAIDEERFLKKLKYRPTSKV